MWVLPRGVTAARAAAARMTQGASRRSRSQQRRSRVSARSEPRIGRADTLQPSGRASAPVTRARAARPPIPRVPPGACKRGYIAPIASRRTDRPSRSRCPVGRIPWQGAEAVRPRHRGPSPPRLALDAERDRSRMTDATDSCDADRGAATPTRRSRALPRARPGCQLRVRTTPRTRRPRTEPSAARDRRASVRSGTGVDPELHRRRGP